MEDEEERERRCDLVSRMFVQLTAKFEDAAAIAVDCQGRHPPEHLREGASKLEDITSGAHVITESLSLILQLMNAEIRDVADDE